MQTAIYRSREARQSRHGHRPVKKSHSIFKVGVVMILALFVVFMATDKVSDYLQAKPVKQITKTSQSSSNSSPSNTVAAVAAPTKVNPCASNTLSQLVLVSISQRHLWACNDATQLYDSAVVTGMENLPADLTPVGTYHIYAKETNITLKGSDSTGSWNDPVSYWMPFLDNQYGAYGFHDATWRANNAFGNISPYSSNASHGCVECPLATAKWLYGWAEVGTTVTIET